MIITMKNIHYLAWSVLLNLSIYIPAKAELVNSYPPSIPTNTPDNKNIQNPATLPPINRADDLITQPATINNNWMQPQPVQNQPNTTSNHTFPLIREDGCRQANPLDFFKDPSAILEKCEKQATIEPLPRTEQLEYFKVPSLDSGVKLRVTDF